MSRGFDVPRILSMCRVLPYPDGTISLDPSPRVFVAASVSFKDSVVSHGPLAPGVPSGLRSFRLARYGVAWVRRLAGFERAAYAPVDTAQNQAPTARGLRASRSVSVGTE